MKVKAKNENILAVGMQVRRNQGEYLDICEWRDRYVNFRKRSNKFVNVKNSRNRENKC